ncbi:MAG: hypothetical protein K6D59_00860 [Bacteroidales bacterium]|nr:hypothetical protein [Bacteroidales bacterium]
MKKFFKLAAIAVCAMGLAVACNNAENTEKQDTPAMDTPAMDTPAVDTMDQDTIAPAEEPEPAKTTAKKTKKPAAKQTNAPQMKEGTSTERNPNVTTSDSRIQSKKNANNVAQKGLSDNTSGKRDNKTAGSKVK